MGVYCTEYQGPYWTLEPNPTKEYKIGDEGIFNISAGTVHELNERTMYCGFEVFTAVTVQNVIFWEETMCNLIKSIDIPMKCLWTSTGLHSGTSHNTVFLRLCIISLYGPPFLSSSS
jgi:hypothetical protein